MCIRDRTDSIVKDIMMIQEIIGTGEIAISDHRSSQPTFEEFTRVDVYKRQVQENRWVYLFHSGKF